ncbi:unnamed protein product [[Candida] boidinii]|uniref:Unnamed protein product n=1 Tax=Candida boidinii TaxID=5477 RepID=A0A9W6WEB6_CANBO|nr:hypothetical protein B5S30_g1341 [[Candida] boidinii]GME66843.1 unnamed protein product [[Candida] boidinii]GMG14616.1 unnamed protein product [[Candida] boidinii]
MSSRKRQSAKTARANASRNAQMRATNGPTSATPQQTSLPPPPPPSAIPPAISLKPTDVTISPALEKLFPGEISFYRKLQTKEKQLDLFINRKVLDLQEHQTNSTNQLNSSTPDNEILRIYIYNTSENQFWQLNEEQRQNIGAQPLPPPWWTLRVEGRLLNPDPVDLPERKKFSSFLSSLSVEIHRKHKTDDELILRAVNGGPSSRIVEWNDHLQNPKNDAEREQQQFDGLDVRRGGSSIPSDQLKDGDSVGEEEEEIYCDITIQPKMYPIRLQVLNESLIELLGCNEITQRECFQRIFSYIKMKNLFEIQNQPQGQQNQQQSQSQQDHGTDPNSVITIKTDDLLYRIFETNSLSMPQILEAISSKLLKPIEPIKIKYVINTLASSTLGDVIIDLKVNSKLLNQKEAPGSSIDVSEIVNDVVRNQKYIDEINRLNETLNTNLQVLNYNKIKYDFYSKLVQDPVNFLETLQKKNAEYLRILSSDSMNYASVDLADEEVIRRSDYYTDEFMSEHISALLNSGRF